MGHIAHLRKQFKSINTYNYIITLIKRRKNTIIIILMRIKWFFFEQNWIPFTQGCFVPSLVEIGSVVLEKKISLISTMYFHYFVIISPWKRAGPFIWTNLYPLHPRMLCAKFGWNWLSGSGEEDFWISSMYFRYFVIISPWRRVGPFIWTNMNLLHPGILCAKFG